jgi:hypothetical protein
MTILFLELLNIFKINTYFFLSLRIKFGISEFTTFIQHAHQPLTIDSDGLRLVKSKSKNKLDHVRL